MDYPSKSRSVIKCLLCSRDADQTLIKSRLHLRKISDIYLSYLKPNLTATTSNVSFDWATLEKREKFGPSKFCLECFTSGQKLVSLNNRLEAIEFEIDSFVQTISKTILKHRSSNKISYTTGKSSSLHSNSKVRKVAVKKKSNHHSNVSGKASEVNIKQEICLDNNVNDELLSSPIPSPAMSMDVDIDENIPENSHIDGPYDSDSWSPEELDPLATGRGVDKNPNKSSSPKMMVVLERVDLDSTRPTTRLQLRNKQAQPSTSSVEKSRKPDFKHFFKQEKEDDSESDASIVECDSDYDPGRENENTSKNTPSKEDNVVNTVYECIHCDKTFDTYSKYKYHRRTGHFNIVGNNCTKCNKTFANWDLLQAHVKAIHHIQQMVCKTCPELPKFANLYDYELHFMTHTGESPFNCKKCDGVFSNLLSYCDHQKYECALSNEVFNCDQCKQTFKAECFLLCHISLYHQKRGERKKGNQMCHICNAKTKNLNLLEVHFAEKHTNELTYSCDICDETFHSTSALKTHRRSHCASVVCNCQFCGENFGYYFDLKEHIKSNHTELHSIHSCEKCGKIFPDNKRYRKHSYDCGKSFTCDICGKDFSSSKAFREHHKGHTEGKPSCTICGRRFETKSGLQSHMLLKHVRKTEFVCDICGKKLLRKDSYLQHIRDHTEGKSRQCKLCGDVLASGTKLREHKKLAHGADLAPCRYCPETFLTFSKRQTHEEKEHLDILSHETKCKTCGMGFLTSAERSKHRESAHPEIVNSRRCEICGKTFNSHSGLFAHIRNHERDSEGPFQCDLCERRFLKQQSLSVHKAQDHNIKNPNYVKKKKKTKS